MRAPVTDLLHDAVRDFASLPPFRDYVDAERILVVATRGRAGLEGKRAACHFTRFSDSRQRVSADGRWELPVLCLHGRDMRYVISFVLPRFLFLSPREQAEDVAHELLHIDRAFDGTAAPLCHGRAFESLVRSLADRAAESGIALPELARPGEIISYHRLRPLPQPYRRADPAARRRYDERDLVLARLLFDPAEREPPPPRYVYECPACGERYPRQRRLRMASCGSCSSTYDGRFKLRLV
ncbi:MAG: hypothetical protein HY812_05410 [Planctomycetes bacterium]|nr:hypothetical protein [Planctomycetota bacterium]